MASVVIKDLDASGSDLTTYPFTLTVSGNAAATYFIGFAGRAVATGRTCDGVTVDGVAATLVVRTQIDLGGVTSNPIGMFLVRAADLPVPTSTALSVSCTFSAGMIRCGVGMAETLDAINTTPTATSSDTDSTGIPDANVIMTLDLNVPQDGIVVAFAFTSSAGTGSDWTTFTGITEDITDVTVETTANKFTGGSASNVTAATPRTVSLVADPGPGVALAGPIAVAASFAPAVAGAARSYGVVIG